MQGLARLFGGMGLTLVGAGMIFEGDTLLHANSPTIETVITGLDSFKIAAREKGIKLIRSGIFIAQTGVNSIVRGIMLLNAGRYLMALGDDGWEFAPSWLEGASKSTSPVEVILNRF